MKENYIKLHKSSGIEVGDKVLVQRKAFPYEMGWDNTWIPEMDECVGNIYTVTKDKYEYGFVLGPYDDKFPCFVLKVVWKKPLFSRVKERIKNLFKRH